MNILIIDDLLLPEPAKADSTQKAFFCKAAKENFLRKNFLAKEFQKLGANVLFASPELCSFGTKLSFEYREQDGISRLFIKIPAKNRRGFLRLREVFEFSSVLVENAPGLSGIFLPDIVFAGGVLPSSVFAAAKIAEYSNAVLITELSCLPTEVLKRFRLLPFAKGAAFFYKKALLKVFEKSHAVLGFFPKAGQKFSGAHNLYPMDFPSPETPENPSKSAFEQKEMLSSFREGKTFVLAFCGELEEGFSIEELILSAGTFGEKFALVFPFEGRKKPYFKRFVAERGITNVFFPDGFSKDDISFVLSGADGIFVSESDFSKGFFPEQENFFLAFNAQKPVIASSEHWSDFFRRAGGVIITKPRRRDSISLGIKTLLSMNETDREILGRSNKAFAEKNSLKNFAKDCFSLFDNFVNQKEIKK